MTDEQDWDAAAADAGYLPTSDYVARWEMAREAAHEALKTAREMITENERLRALVKEAQIEGWLAADSYGISDYEYQQIWEKSQARAALQPKEDK